MKEHDLVSVFVGSSVNSRYLEAVLSQSNIACLIRSGVAEVLPGGYGGPQTGNSCEIFVEQQDYEIAEKLIFEFINSNNKE